MMKAIKLLIGLTFILYLSGGAFLFFYQDDFLYQPSEEYPVDESIKYPDDYGVKYFLNEGQKLKAVVLKPSKENAIIYFGGSGEAMAATAPQFIGVFPNHALYLVDYRGYAGSTGEPSERAFYSDALAIYDELSDQYGEVSVIGFSLGSGVATYLASKRALHSLSLVAPYDSMLSLAQELYPFYPISILLEDKYDSIGRVDNVSEKALIIVAEWDQAIPYKLTRRLIDAFPTEQIKVKMIDGVGHNSLTGTDEYYSLLREFHSR